MLYRLLHLSICSWHEGICALERKISLLQERWVRRDISPLELNEQLLKIKREVLHALPNSAHREQERFARGHVTNTDELIHDNVITHIHAFFQCNVDLNFALV